MYLYEHSEVCLLCDKKSVSRSYCKYHYEKLLREKKITPHEKWDRETQFLRKLLWNIIARCTHPNTNRYERYGGRGIQNFLTIEDLRYLYRRDNGPTLERPSIDRRDSDGNYDIDNCRFIEWRENTEDGLQRGRAVHQENAKRKLCVICKHNPRAMPSTRCVDCRDYRVCNKCGSKMLRRRQSRYCDACRYATRPCGQCDTPITRDVILWNPLRNHTWFCSKECQGRFLGSHYGRGRRK